MSALISQTPLTTSSEVAAINDNHQSSDGLMKSASLSLTAGGNYQIDKSFFENMLVGGGKYMTNGGTSPSPTPPSSVDHGGISVHLLNKDLWEKFHRATNEMVVTKPGRRMFPKIELRIFGLDPKANYLFLIAMRPTDNHRYKFQGGCWSPSGQDDMPECSNPLYHHDGPIASGEYWMKNAVSFDKVKLTNRTNVDGGQQISLQSMHKYQPFITIYKVLVRSGGSGVSEVLGSSCVYTFTPRETQFIAVTAYQSERIIQLKVQHNPFAKGFREGSVRKRSLSISPDSESSPTSSNSGGGSAVKRTRGAFQIPDSTHFSSSSLIGATPSTAASLEAFRSASGVGPALPPPFSPYYYNALAYSANSFGRAALSQLTPYGEVATVVKPEAGQRVNERQRSTGEGTTSQSALAQATDTEYGGVLSQLPLPNNEHVQSSGGGGSDWRPTTTAAATEGVMGVNPYWSFFQNYHRMFAGNSQRDC